MDKIRNEELLHIPGKKNMKGVIVISQLELKCRVGVGERERKKMQKLYADIEVGYDISKCVESDSILDAIDYDQIGALCLKKASEREYHLLETLSHRLVEAILQTFPCFHVKVMIHKKPWALVVEGTR